MLVARGRGRDLHHGRCGAAESAWAAPEVDAMTGTILVPLDGSNLARHALPYAAHLAQATHARLVVFHAYRANNHDAGADPELDLVIEQADLASGLRDRGVNATTWLSYDEP